MTEQQYRVHACNNAEPHKVHEFRGTYRKPSLPGVEITETFQCEGIERPVPTTDEPQKPELVTLHLYRDACVGGLFLSERELDRTLHEHVEALTIRRDRLAVPSLPTREQIAEVVLANFHAPDRTHASWWINPDATADAVLALIRKGADR